MCDELFHLGHFVARGKLFVLVTPCCPSGLIGLALIKFFEETFSQEFVVMSVLYLNWQNSHSPQSLTL